MSTTTTIELNCDGDGCTNAYPAGPDERWFESVIRAAAARDGWQVRNTRRRGKRVPLDLCPACRPQPHDQGPWHCAERGCPGGHMLPNASCAAAQHPEEGK